VGAKTRESATSSPQATPLSASRWPRVAGIALLVASLFLYRSFENREVFGFWSYSFAEVLACSIGLLLGVIALSVAAIRKRQLPSRSGQTFDLAVFIWGMAYFATALDDSSQASRILDGNFLGSAVPFAIVADWVSLVLATVAAVVWAVQRTSETGRKLLLVTASLLFIGLMGECGVRTRALVAPQSQGFPTLTSEQWKRRFVDFNSEGFRDVEHAKAAAPGEHRLLVVGDSFAYGTGVNELEGRFGELLSEMLSEETGEQWLSLSAALPDSHTLDEIAYLEKMAPYACDAVVLIYVFNDIDYLVAVTPRGELSEAPKGLLARLNPSRLLYANFYFFQEVFVYARLARYARGAGENPSESAYADVSAVAQHMEDLARFVHFAQADGVPVFIIPFEMWTSPDADESQIHAEFVALGREHGLPILDLSGAFKGEDVTGLRVSRLDAHPNARANRIAAEWVLEEVSEAIQGGAAQPAPSASAPVVPGY